MVTAYFTYLVSPFIPGLLAKTRALDSQVLNAHQKSRLREAISIDIRKMCDIVIPAARYPRVSKAAKEKADELGVDLTTLTWHAQKKVDNYQLFTYEHMTPVKVLAAALTTATGEAEALDILDAKLSVAFITKDEDKQLRQHGYAHNRPDPAAAYQAAGIHLLPAPDDPDVAVPATSGNEPATRPNEAFNADAPPLTRAWALLPPPAHPAPPPIEDVPQEVIHDYSDYWEPLLHLTIWGLGWLRPDIGLARWQAAGKPRIDPVLAHIDAWWGRGDQLDDFLAWAARSSALVDFAVDHAATLHEEAPDAPHLTRDLPSTEEYARRYEDPRWAAVWDFYDPFATPDGVGFLARAKRAWYGLDERNDFNPVPIYLPDGSVMVASLGYDRWATAPRHYQWAGSGPERTVSSVYVSSIGYLGTYRRSEATGLWHRTDERTHLLGYPGFEEIAERIAWTSTEQFTIRPPGSPIARRRSDDVDLH